jgi:hypothetical protein
MQSRIQFSSDPYEEATRSLEAAAVNERRNHTEPNAWWQSVPGALTWLMDLLIEGFAAYGAAMSPGYFQPIGTDAERRREVAEASRSNHPSHQRHQMEHELSTKWREEDLDVLLMIKRS